MSTKTRAELVRKIAENVGLAQPGEVLSAEDVSTIGGAIGPAVAMLGKLEIADIGSVEEIEEEFFLPLADWIADKIKASYNKPGDAALAAAAAQAETDMRVLSRPTASRRTLSADNALLRAMPGTYRF
jgi:hypothetical protein